jgi:hypothetical protein
MPDTHLILHVKGTEQETTVLPKHVVRAAISQGQITHSQLIWSVADNTWKQVRQLPHLWPSQKLAPAPVRVPTGALPKVTAAPQAVPMPKVATATGSVPRIAKPAVGAPPKVTLPGSTPVAKAAVPTARAAAVTPEAKAAVPVAQPAKNYVVKEDDAGAHPLKWVSIFLGVLIVGLVVVNYFLVDRSLVSGLGQTPYSGVTVYAHLGAYLQPNVIVIHVPKTNAITNENLTDFLVALAHSTPSIPLSSNLFDRVALTSGWTASYTLSGYAWKQLGDMGKDDEAQRKEFLLDQLADAVGDPLITSRSNEDEATLLAEREKVWDTFAAQFVRP